MELLFPLEFTFSRKNEFTLAKFRRKRFQKLFAQTLRDYGSRGTLANSFIQFKLILDLNMSKVIYHFVCDVQWQRRRSLCALSSNDALLNHQAKALTIDKVNVLAIWNITVTLSRVWIDIFAGASLWENVMGCNYLFHHELFETEITNLTPNGHFPLWTTWRQSAVLWCHRLGTSTTSVFWYSAVETRR